MKDQLIDLFMSSTIIQGTLTIMVTGVWLYMIAIGAAVPDGLNAVVTLVVGFYFGSKVQQVQIKSKGGA